MSWNATRFRAGGTALAAAVGLAICSPAAADEAIAAAQALAEGRFSAACTAIENLPDTPDGWFVRGRCAAIRGDHHDAIGWFERILAAVDAPRTRLELARSLAMVGERREASQQLDAVLRSGPPGPIRDSILTELAALAPSEAAQTRYWRMGVGGVYDTNVNVGPRNANVTIFGLPFQLSDGSLGKPDKGLTSWLGGETRKATPWGDLHVAAQLDGTQYEAQKSLSYLILGTQASLRNTFGKLELTWTVGKQNVRQRSDVRRDALYGSGSALTTLRNNLALWVTLNTGTNKLHSENPIKSRPASLEFGVRQMQVSGSVISGGMRVLRERFDSADQSHEDRSLFLAREDPFHFLSTSCVSSISGTVSQADYQADDAIFELRRRDRLAQAALTVVCSAAGSPFGRTGLWRVSLDSSNNRSSLAVQRYARTRMQVSREISF